MKNNYDLFFSNNLPPLIALNYADELFFKEFENLCGKRYRILSIIKRGWQNKYGLYGDINKLGKTFELKLKDEKWSSNLLKLYEAKSLNLRELLSSIEKRDYSNLSNLEIVKDIKEVRKISSTLDAMSNMLHLFSSIIGHKFFESLSNYSKDRANINLNFIYYTQPIKESRFAKINSKKLENPIKLSKKDENFSNILRIGAFVKDDVSELLDLRKKIMVNLFREASSRLKCALEDLEYLQISEIESFLINNENNFNNLVNERKNITIIYYPKSKLEILEGKKAETLLEKGKFKEISITRKETVLKGQIASLGRVIGKAKVVFNSKEAEAKIEKGDILVAPYTAVEYLTSMKKASGIITETGGVTSHAAIVSRELNIPCIVGLKEATKRIKDGQKIELNADEGKVRLL